MKKVVKHRSKTQYYIDISDRLSAARSAYGLLYVLIIAVLIFSCVFNCFYRVVPVRDAGEQDEVSVLVRYRGYSVSKGAFIKLRSGGCAYVTDVCHIPGDDYGFRAVAEGEKGPEERQYGFPDAEGEIRMILFPLERMGEDPISLITAE